MFSHSNRKVSQLAAVAHTFIPSSWEVELCKFKAGLVYIVSFREARAREGDPVSKRNRQTDKQTKVINRLVL